MVDRQRLDEAEDSLHVLRRKAGKYEAHTDGSELHGTIR